MADMDCRRAEELLHERLDEPLAPDLALRLEGHLARCASCRLLESELAELHDLAMGEEPFDDPSPEWEAELVARWETARRRERRLEKGTARPRLRLILASLALLLLLLPLGSPTDSASLLESLSLASACASGAAELVESGWTSWGPDVDLVAELLPDGPVRWVDELEIPLPDLPPSLPFAEPTVETVLLFLVTLGLLDVALLRTFRPRTPERSHP